MKTSTPTPIKENGLAFCIHNFIVILPSEATSGVGIYIAAADAAKPALPATFLPRIREE
jgi:hypothetical protein